MAKFLYTISSHARVTIEKEGELPLSLQHWVMHHKFFDAKDISFMNTIFNLQGFRCILKVYYVCELVDSCFTCSFAATGSTLDEAKKLLFELIPKRYISSLKNPKYDKSARRILERYESNDAF